jgi:hypothetical protein
VPGGRQDDRSPELDQVRQMLFPGLPEEEGWARIDAAIAGARDLNADLEARLREATDVG